MNRMKTINGVEPTPRAAGRTENPRARWLLLAALVSLAAAARLLPHPPNFSPIGAMALFGGACFASRSVAFLLPLLALFASDLVLGVGAVTPVVYASFAVSTLLGRWIRSRRRAVPVALATVAGSIQFFLVTNFACWLFYYPHSTSGLIDCYVAAVPFFRNTLLGDAFFSGLLFGAVALAEAGFPALREPADAAPICS